MKNERVRNNLEHAIKTMRDAVDDAEWEMNSARSDMDAATSILHAFAWGFANASSSIESSMNAIHDANEIEKYKLVEKANKS